MQLIIYGGRLPRDFCPSGAMHVCLATGRASAFFVPYRQTRPALPGKAKQTCYMETNVIQRKDTRVAAINEWLAAKAQSLSKWYNGRSKSFSPLAGNVFSKKSSFPLPVHKLSLPLLSLTITNYRAASGIGHCSAFWLGHFFMPLLYPYWRLPFRNYYCSLRRSRDCKQRDVQPPFCISASGGFRICLQLRNMETNVIQRKDTRVAAINEWLAAKTQSLSKWYNGRSRFYSKLTGFEVKWKTAVRVNLFSLFVVITAVVAAQQPLVSAVSAVCSAWVAYRLNSDEKEGGRK